MFKDCTNLSSINVDFKDWSENNKDTNNWVVSTATRGIFTCPMQLGTNTTINRGTSNCPTSWTVINK